MHEVYSLSLAEQNKKPLIVPIHKERKLFYDKKKRERKKKELSEK